MHARVHACTHTCAHIHYIGFYYTYQCFHIKIDINQLTLVIPVKFSGYTLRYSYIYIYMINIEYGFQLMESGFIRNIYDSLIK